MEKPKFLSFRRPNGHNEFEEFMESLPIKDFQKLHAVITSIEEFSILTAIQQEWVKKLNSEIYEIRSKVSTNIQRVLYFHESNNMYIITHGFTKKTQKTPTREINHAITIKKEYEKEIKNATRKYPNDI